MRLLAIAVAVSVGSACLTPVSLRPGDVGSDAQDAGRENGAADCSVAPAEGVDGGSVFRPSACIVDGDCPAGTYCDVVLSSCGGLALRSTLLSSRCVAPSCTTDCFKKPCASNDDCPED